MAPHSAAFLLFACLAASSAFAVRDDVIRDVIRDQATSNSSALIDTKHKKLRTGGYCSGWCLTCTDTGVEWKVNRGSTLGSKLAKLAAVAAGVALIAMTGGLAGAAGALFMGAATAMGAGTTLVIGAGAIGAAHLLTNTEERMCPVVSFDEKLPANKGLIAGTKHNFLNLFNKAEHKEQSFKLVDVNYMELLLRVHQGDGSELMKGDRSDMGDDDRLHDAIACNYMTFDDKLWLQKKQEETNTVIPESTADEMKAGIVDTCGKWLCAGNAGGAHKPSISSGWSCGGRTNIIKALWR